MSSLEATAHAIIAHMTETQKGHLLSFVIYGRLSQQGYACLVSRGLIREDEYGSTVLSDLGIEIRKLVDGGKV